MSATIDENIFHPRKGQEFKSVFNERDVREGKEALVVETRQRPSPIRTDSNLLLASRV